VVHAEVCEVVMVEPDERTADTEEVDDTKEAEETSETGDAIAAETAPVTANTSKCGFESTKESEAVSAKERQVLYKSFEIKDNQ
jgi:hypothetical protein